MPTLKIAYLFSLPPLHTQKIGGARHVDVQKGAAHEEVGRFRRHVLGELGKPLRRDDACQPALPAPAHEVGHCGEREAASLVAHVACNCWREHLRFVHDDEGGEPLFARGIEERGEKERRAAHLRLDFEAIQREHDRGAMLPDARCQPGDLTARIGRAVDHHMPEGFGERDEVPLGIDHHLLNEGCALFQQAAQQMRFARAAIALNEQASRQQLLYVDADRRTRGIGADFNECAHVPGHTKLSPRAEGREGTFPQIIWTFAASGESGTARGASAPILVRCGWACPSPPSPLP